MPLLDLKTDLKSLKYGNDQPGGGNSGQPYQRVDINKADNAFNQFRLNSIDDGLVRGGKVGATNASVVDVFRIGKFLKDFPKGPLWLAKQSGLQKSGPRLEAKELSTSRPTAGQGLFRNIANVVSNVVNRITNVIGPTRIYNPLGTNTLLQVGVNAFGGHLVRHGFLPIQNNDVLYFRTAEFNNKGTSSANRLVKLMSIIGNPAANIDEYPGGPSSKYGIGTTLIRRRGNFQIDNQDVTETYWARVEAKDVGKGYRINGHGGDLEGYDNAFRRIGNFIQASLQTRSDYVLEPINIIPVLRENLGDIVASNDDKTIPGEKVNNKVPVVDGKIRTGALREINSYTSSSFAINPFYINLNPDKPNDVIKSQDWKGDKTWIPQGEGTNIGKTVFPTAVGTGSKSISTYGDTATKPTNPSPAVATYDALKSKIKTSISQPTAGGTFTTNAVNINRTAPDFKYIGNNSKITAFERTNDTNVDSDTMALVFNPLDPFTGTSLGAIKFLGYISSYSDTNSSTWNSTQYVGRAEKFYIFNEFKRSVSLGFNIPCFNKAELSKKHQDLNKLVSTLAGRYNGNGLLGGVINYITVGNYVANQPSIIESLNFSPIENTSWDLDEKLAFYIKVDMSFTLIHNFLPQYGANFINV